MSAFQLAPGTLFAGDYRILRPLSQGGMGAVFVAEQLSTRAERALKLMHPQLVRDPVLRGRFEQEAKIASQIPSDHVVQVIAAGVDDASGMPWLAMELLDGTDLLEAAATGRAGPAVLREIMAQLCHALGAAHERGIVHRDLKPENIFLAAPRRSGIPFTVKVLDFGISKMTSEAASASTTASLGTPLWMAPEQAGASSGVISPATDVWALGLIAFWLLSGRHYWLGAREDGVTLQALMREVLFDPLVPASQRAHELANDARLPPGFDAWFDKCVQREPKDRFPDANVAGAELEQCLAQSHQAGALAAGVGGALATSGPAGDDAPSLGGAPEAMGAAGAPVARTVDDMPPLRINTPPAPPPAGHVPVRTDWVTPGPQPRISPLPPTPHHVPAYGPPPGIGHTTGAPWASTPSAAHSEALSYQVEPRRGGCAAMAIATLAIVAGVIVAAFFTRDTWEPTLLSYLGETPESPTPPPAPPKPTAPQLKCPDGTRRQGDVCMKLIDTRCPSGMRFSSRGCVAIVAAQDPDAGSAKPSGTSPAVGPKPSGGMMKDSQLWVKCQPECQSVRIDGKSFGPSPVRAVLPPGRHTVLGQRNGYSGYSTSVVTAVARTDTVTLRLTPNAASPGASKTPAKTCDCSKKTNDVGCNAFCAMQKK